MTAASSEEREELPHSTEKYRNIWIQETPAIAGNMGANMQHPTAAATRTAYVTSRTPHVARTTESPPQRMRHPPGTVPPPDNVTDDIMFTVGDPDQDLQFDPFQYDPDVLSRLLNAHNAAN